MHRLGDSRPPIAFIGIPLDSSGTRRGDELGTRALREAGLIERLGLEDGGDVDAHVGSPRRDSASGVIDVEAIQRTQAAARQAVGDQLRDGRLPLPVGGDDAYLPGVLAGVRDVVGSAAMVFLDGHLDACDGASSPTGEAADMGLATATGRGPSALMSPLGPAPVIDPGNVWALGFRENEEPSVELAGGGIGREMDLLDPRVRSMSSAEVRRDGERRVAERVAAELDPELPVWLHIDLDVLDEAGFPATSYPATDGLDWEGLERFAGVLIERRSLVGIDVSCLNGELDAGGVYARRTVAMLEALL